MSRPIIEVDGISKRYRLGQYNAHSLRDEAQRLFRRRGSRPERAADSRLAVDLWALKDVSFSVQPGEVLGIIGRNGAGKSTLLKVLSRITEPTEGAIRIRGRVASLLEVGTGFHPELTGRENIFLNGTILGMSIADVKATFDEIVAFAEVERFLDTPVKRYSSGMYVRLAFAIAAHLEPEILVIDEVLAVGDLAFQRKCLGKIDALSTGSGRTVLFVSHNMPMIQVLCTRVALLSDGRLSAIGETVSILDEYLSAGRHQEQGVVDATMLPRSAGSERAISRIWIENQSGDVVNSVMMGESMVLCFEFFTSKPIHGAGVGFGIETAQQVRLMSFNNYLMNDVDVSVDGAAVARCSIEKLQLLPGRYYCSFSVVAKEREWVDYVERAASFDVVPSDVYGTGRTPHSSQGIFWAPATIDIQRPGRA